DLDDDDVKLFGDEAEELFELLDTALVQLEDAADSELVQQIFRAEHTLKGSSATIGHKKMTALTHAMETVLDAVRQGKAAPSPEMVDALLAALDALRVLAREVVTRIDSGTDIVTLEARLNATLEAGSSRGLTPERTTSSSTDPRVPSAGAIEAARAASEAGRSVYVVELAVASDCQLPSIRCFQALQELDAVASVLECWPGRAEIEAGAGEFAFAAFAASNSAGDEIQGLLAAISDIATVSVEPASLEDVAEVPAANPSTSGPARLTLVEPSSPIAAPAPRKASPSVRIDVERLDGLMNLVGELVIDRTRLQRIRAQLGDVLRDANATELTQNFEETTNHLAHITSELQDEIMRSRMLPIRSVLARLPRIVRDVATRCGKRVELTTAGEETELDRSVVEEIADPLVHILRNAIDHGIETPEERLAAGKPETGRIAVTAWNQESYIYLSVKDDGRGIDTATLRRKAVERGLVSREAAAAASDNAVVQYIFFAGLSTAQALSDVSGRGVGMDIVRTNIERLNGQVTVQSTPGEGSEFVIQLPLTLATTQALLVAVDDVVYALPLVSVTEALSEADADLHQVSGHTALRLRGKLLPVVDLANALGDRRQRTLDGSRALVA
ncbi:MAG: chemotaxis protein CheA, partial [Tepidiformaceae bacterium]